tara:strand:+ start:43 stop:327 length:285 start_codon:yes stop_codon:yes gene_type:complete
MFVYGWWADMNTALNKLTDTYDLMLQQHFSDVLKDREPYCAQEFQIEQGHEMTEMQRKALSTFCDFWEVLQHMEDFKWRLNKQQLQQKENNNGV